MPVSREWNDTEMRERLRLHIENGTIPQQQAAMKMLKDKKLWAGEPSPSNDLLDELNTE